MIDNCHKYETMIFANGAEAFKELLGKVYGKNKLEKLYIEHSLCDRAFFWGG